jgi:ribonucleoside-diphosphate reductase alpha chain
VKGGMRNATLMAVAPNANIGLVAGTTPGIDPRFAQVFSRNKISGKYMDINHNLVKDLKNLGIWDEVKDKIVELQGDIAAINEIPSYLKQIYKTSFTTSPYAYIEVAARAQKWVDQALSRNMYLESRDMDEMKQVYMTAWKRGLKTTYYLHMKPRHTAEQSTTNVNKGAAIGKRGFAAVASSVAEQPTASPIQVSPVTVQEVVPMQPSASAQPVVEAVMPPTPATRGFSPVAAQAPLPITPVTPAVQQTIPEVAAAPAETPIARMGFATVAAAPVVPMVAQPTPVPAVVDTAAATPVPAAAPVQAATPQAAAAPVKKKPLVCPTDPAELAQCDACQ